MHAPTVFLIAAAWSMNALAQTNNTPNQTDASTGGIIFGLFVLVAAVVVGGIIFVVLKRRKHARK